MRRSQSGSEGIAKYISRMSPRNFRRFASQPAQESTSVPDSTIEEQFLPESIEICCPVCGCINLSQDETGQTFCDECDFVDVVEI
jgi:hypothetical protein